MICFIERRPILQVGEQQVADYGTDWIEVAIKRAVNACNREDFPFVEEIRDGVVHYLENTCSLKMLPIEDLYTRMRYMLKRIGCEAIGDKLEMVAPPMKVSLAHQAERNGVGFEMGFYQSVLGEIAQLCARGVEELVLTELNQSVLILQGKDDWCNSCEELRQDMEDWISKLAMQAASYEKRPVYLAYEK